MGRVVLWATCLGGGGGGGGLVCNSFLQPCYNEANMNRNNLLRHFEIPGLSQNTIGILELKKTTI